MLFAPSTNNLTPFVLFTALVSLFLPSSKPPSAALTASSSHVVGLNLVSASARLTNRSKVKIPPVEVTRDPSRSRVFAWVCRLGSRPLVTNNCRLGSDCEISSGSATPQLFFCLCLLGNFDPRNTHRKPEDDNYSTRGTSTQLLKSQSSSLSRQCNWTGSAKRPRGSTSSSDRPSRSHFRVSLSAQI